MATQQSQAVGIANEMLAMAARLQSLYGDIVSLARRYTNDGADNVWKALATAALNADGSLGAADGAPVNSHPINIGVVTGLNRAVSENQLVTFVSNLQALQAYFEGGVVAQADRRSVIDGLCGG